MTPSEWSSLCSVGDEKAVTYLLHKSAEPGSFGEQALIPHLSHDPTMLSGSRANLGLVNNSARTIDVEAVDVQQAIPGRAVSTDGDTVARRPQGGALQ